MTRDPEAATLERINPYPEGTEEWRAFNYGWDATCCPEREEG